MTASTTRTWALDALCRDRLDLVDAAFDRPGGYAGKALARLCRQCPVQAQCFAEAITSPEWGVWAGTSPHRRTAHGAPSAAAKVQRPRLFR